MFGLCFDLMLYRYHSGQVRDSPAHCGIEYFRKTPVRWSPVSQCAALGVPQVSCFVHVCWELSACAAYISVMRIPKLHLLLVFAFSWILGLDSARLSILERKKSFTKHFGINTVLIVTLILQMPLQISDLEFIL